ncbi:MAG: OsmC family protein [Phenylobacterium sp.]|uniref:OsmC family protein n=1 Tax=Phenylobacterium sp. TaxID=1871053 RepID=UPI0027367610|nr:OsmC family protein [Phenylobacterium sp.]MDP1640547.1 OsmC family protein [Phenylobacterium sp.]MDP3117596.1 OsmC family protein [Phenylobacterium sp.]MDP3383153.1 OsmC family protein [Phenylobacterium sp.]
MATYRASVTWRLSAGEDFPAGRYSRGHELGFDRGTAVPGTASSHVVGNKWSVEGAVDPEQMLVASLSSCHMLTFLHRARLAGFAVASYADAAEGVMSEISPGRQAVTKVTLHPTIEWAGAAPDAETLARLHHEAHEECFIANSVKTEVVVA